MNTPRQYAENIIARYIDGDFSRATVISLIEEAVKFALLDAAALCEAKHLDDSCDKKDVGQLIRYMAEQD